jgi:hypothetical protein
VSTEKTPFHNCSLTVSIFLILIISCAITSSCWSQQDAIASKKAQHYILDYDVPESPAFVGLGVTPAKILRGSSAKPIVVNLLSQMGGAQKIQTGLAVDFSPYFTLFNGGLKNITEYRSNFWKRMLANTLLSFGTAQAKQDTNSLLWGIGLRSTLFDSRDLLQDKELGEDIDNILVKKDTTPPLPGPDTETLKTINLSTAYNKARKKVLESNGGAMSIGYCLSGNLRNSIPRIDSVDAIRHQTWVSYKYSLKRVDILSIYQGRFAKHILPEHRVGLAVRKNSEMINVAGEVVYTTISKRVEVGGNAEIKMMPGLRAVVSVSTEQPTTKEFSSVRLKLNTTLRWDLSEQK